MQQLRQAHADTWQQIAVADTDDDGRVSLAEYQTKPGVLASPDASVQVFKSLYDAVAQVADSDGDGKLTEDEYARMNACRMSVPEDQARAAFRRLDSDGDGLVTADEITESVRDYHFSDDPSSFGSWLLGPPEPA
jgi:Ca2+-binding EF-hand superfamily protein